MKHARAHALTNARTQSRLHADASLREHTHKHLHTRTFVLVGSCRTRAQAHMHAEAHTHTPALTCPRTCTCTSALLRTGASALACMRRRAHPRMSAR
eukprot:7537442-Alexandrium_andersonii.AAC.1